MTHHRPSDPPPVRRSASGAMSRRRLLALLGLGAAGSVGAGRALRKPNREPATAPTSSDGPPLERPTAGVQRIVWSVDTDSPLAALTFDDGPDPEFTPQILDILERFDVPGTFMVMGYNAEHNQKMVREMIARGHEIGGHGWRHLNLAEVGVPEVKREVGFGIERIEDIAGVETKVFRPPYGRMSEATVQMLGQLRKDLIIWSVTRGDLGWEDPQRIARHIVRETKPGSVIDLHDGIGRGTFARDEGFAQRLRRRRMIEIDALPRVIRGIQDKGIELVTVTSLLNHWKPSSR